MSSPISFPSLLHLRRLERLAVADIVVKETADWAAGHSMTLHPDAVAAIEDFGEHLRKMIVEAEG